MGILAPARAIDWRGTGAGSALSTGWPTCNTTPIPQEGLPGAGNAIAPTTIENAIQSCASAHPTGGVVLLAQGNFYYNSSIRWDTTTVSGQGAAVSNVVLRGSGVGINQTHIYFTSYNNGAANTVRNCSGDQAMICISNYNALYAQSTQVQPGGVDAATWTGGFTHGTTSITVQLPATSNGISIANGPMMILLDQDSDFVFLQSVQQLTPGSTLVTATATGPLPRAFQHIGNQVQISGVGCYNALTRDGTTYNAPGTVSSATPNAFSATIQGFNTSNNTFTYNAGVSNLLLCDGGSTTNGNIGGTGISGTMLPISSVSGTGNPANTVTVQLGAPYNTTGVPAQLTVGSQMFIGGVSPFSNSTLERLQVTAINTSCGGTTGTCTSTPAPGAFQYTSSIGGSATGTGTSFAWYEGGVAVADDGSNIVCNATNLCGYKGAQYVTDQNTIGRFINGKRRQRIQETMVTGITVGGTASNTCAAGQTCVLTISPGLYGRYDQNPNPGVWWINDTQHPAIRNDGIENLTVDLANAPGSGAPNAGLSTITIYGCSGCWVSGISSLHGNRNHIWLYYSMNSTVRDSYFFGTHGTGGSTSYGIENYIGTNNLVENNIFQQISGPEMPGPTQGNVIAYNFSTNNLNSATGLFHQFWTSHDNDFFSLYEGNLGSGFRGDSTFEESGFVTLFRNYSSGADWSMNNAVPPVNVPKPYYTYTLSAEMWNRYWNIIGNVLGNSPQTPLPGITFANGGPGGNVQTRYETSVNACTPTPCVDANADLSIYVFGYPGGRTDASCFDTGQCYPDPKLAGTMMRWGNYDIVKGPTLGPQFNSLEVPSSDPFYPNSVPASQTLPPSFYLPGQPAWWKFPGAPLTLPGPASPWPGIGPDVPGGPGPGGHAYMNPAMNCYLNMMHGPANGGDTWTDNGAWVTPGGQQASYFDMPACYYPPPPSGGTLTTKAVKITGPVTVH